MVRSRRLPLASALTVALTVVTAASHSPLSADAGDTGASQRAVAATLSVGSSHACYVANGLL